MSSIGQLSSSQRKEKDIMKGVTPLQEKESENADLRRQIHDLQLRFDDIQTRYEDLEAEQRARDEVIERQQARMAQLEDLEAEQRAKNEVIESQQARIARLLDMCQDLLRKRYQDSSAFQEEVSARRDRLRASNDSYHPDSVQVQKVMGKESGSVTLAASKTAETKERTNPQFKQSGLHRHAEELESQKISTDTTEEEFETVKDKKYKLADSSSSKAPVLAGSLSNKNSYSILDQADPWKKPKLPKKAEVPNQNPADKWYVAPPPNKGKSDEQSRAGLTVSTPRPISYSAPDTNLSTPPGTSGWSSGDRHGFKTFHSKERSPVVQGGSAPQAPKPPPNSWISPQPEDVRSLASPHKAGSVKDYAQIAATSARSNSGGTNDYFYSLVEDHKKRYGVDVDVDKKLAEVRQRLAAESSKAGEEQTRGVDSSSHSKSRQPKATTHGDRALEAIDKDLGNALWSDDVEEDGGVEVPGRSNQSAAVDPSREKGFTPTRQPAEAALPPADRAPQISEHVGKEPQPRSQEAEIGPDNKTSPVKAKEQETHRKTFPLPLGSEGPSFPPGHVRKPKSETEGAYFPGSNAPRRKKRDKKKDTRVKIYQAGGGGTGDDGTKGDLSGSRSHR